VQCGTECMDARGWIRSVLLAWRSWRAGRCPDGAEGAEAAVVLADGDEAPSRLAGRQDPPHLVQGLLPQAVRLRSHAHNVVVMGNEERDVSQIAQIQMSYSKRHLRDLYIGSS
jgi:hypothetical protein